MRSTNENSNPYNDIWLCTHNKTCVNLPCKRTASWEDDLIGRRIVDEAWIRRFGGMGYDVERPGYEERDIGLYVNPILDNEGYVKAVSVTKEQQTSWNHGRNTFKQLNLNKGDVRAIRELLEKVFVPLSEPEAFKAPARPQDVSSVLPRGWTLDSLMSGHEALCHAVESGDIKTARKYAKYSRVVLPACDDMKKHPFLYAVREGNLHLVRALYASGAYLYDTCFIYGSGRWSALRFAAERSDLDMARFLVGKGALEKRENYWSEDHWDYPGKDYNYALLDTAVSGEMTELIVKNATRGR